MNNKTKTQNKTRILAAVILAAAVAVYWLYEQHTAQNYKNYAAAHNCTWAYYTDGREVCKK